MPRFRAVASRPVGVASLDGARSEKSVSSVQSVSKKCDVRCLRESFVSWRLRGCDGAMESALICAICGISVRWCDESICDVSVFLCDSVPLWFNRDGPNQMRWIRVIRSNPRSSAFKRCDAAMPLCAMPLCLRALVVVTIPAPISHPKDPGRNRSHRIRSRVRVWPTPAPLRWREAHRGGRAVAGIRTAASGGRPGWTRAASESG